MMCILRKGKIEVLPLIFMCILIKMVDYALCSGGDDGDEKCEYLVA